MELRDEWCGVVESILDDHAWDSATNVLRSRAADAQDDAPVLLAVAAWTAVISERFVVATEIAQEARLLAVSGVGSNNASMNTLLEALVTVIAAVAGTAPFDQDALDGVFEAILGRQSSEERSFRFACRVLEVPNWFTFADRLSDARRALDISQQLDRESVSWLEDSMCLGCVAELEWRRGRWNIATAAAIAAARGPAGTLNPDEDPYCQTLLARIAAAQGDTDRARSLARSARMTALGRGDHSSRWRADAADALVAIGAGNYAQVVRLLAKPVEGNDRLGTTPASVRQCEVDLIEAMIRIGHDGHQVMYERLGFHGGEWNAAAALRIDGLRITDPVRAAECALASAAEFARLDAVFDEARSLLVAGERLAEACDFEAAKAALEAANSRFDSLGARPWLQRCRAQLRAFTRVRSGDVSGVGLDVGGHATFDSLTDQERAIATAVCRGLTNRQVAEELFISVKGVETHLTRVYRKLGVKSRSALVAVSAEARPTA